MNFIELISHCDIDSLAMEEEGYDSLVPKDDVVLLIKADRDNEWYRATYIQLCDPVKCWGEDGEDTSLVLITQLEGLPEDPNNTTDLNNIEIRAFGEIK